MTVVCTRCAWVDTYAESSDGCCVRGTCDGALKPHSGSAWQAVAKAQLAMVQAVSLASEAREYGEGEGSPYAQAAMSAECKYLMAIEIATGC